METSSYESKEQYKMDNNMYSNTYETTMTFGLGPYYSLTRKEQIKLEKKLKEETEEDIIKKIYTKKNLFSKGLILETIDNFINIQHQSIYGVPPHDSHIESLREGFLLFNINNKNTRFLDKQSIICFLNNPNVSEEEKKYFLDIYLQINKPHYLTKMNVENLRSCCHF